MNLNNFCKHELFLYYHYFLLEISHLLDLLDMVDLNLKFNYDFLQN